MSLRISTAILAFIVSATGLEAEPTPMKWRIDGTERVALVFPPSESTEGKPPVILAFHGHGGNMHFAARGMRFQDAWPAALVVYLQGLPTPSLLPEQEDDLRPGWQRQEGELNNRDLKYVDAVLATLHEKYAVDDRRIYATGFSNGGFFTYLLWAERPNLFAAFAPGGAILLPSVQLKRARAALLFGGQHDRLVKFTEQQRTMEEVRALDRCAPRGQPCGNLCTLYPSSIAPVVTFVHPGGHVYPPPVTALIVKFFQEHPRGF